MATDALVALQASVTKTATFNGAWINLPGGTPVHGMRARVIYSAASNASGSNTVTFSLDTSADGSTLKGTGIVQGADNVLTLSATAQSGEFDMPFIVTDPYVRLTVTISGAGSTPTVTYQGDLELN